MATYHFVGTGLIALKSILDRTTMRFMNRPYEFLDYIKETCIEQDAERITIFCQRKDFNEAWDEAEQFTLWSE